MTAQYFELAWAGPTIGVHCFIPSTGDLQHVLFVLHGVERNADAYFEAWLPHAQQLGLTLVVPHFSTTHFPTSAEYQLGNTVSSSKHRKQDPCSCCSEQQQQQQQKQHVHTNSQDVWAFTCIEQLFDQLQQQHSITASSYMMYGHSAGAQFVHRFVLHMPQSRCSLAIAANAGWYTLPNTQHPWPYGLQGSAIADSFTGTAARVLGQPLVLLLGDADTDRQCKNLRRTRLAAAQGVHRFERGHTFLAAAQATAGELGVPCNWQLLVVPGAAHDSGQMMPAALELMKQHKQQQQQQQQQRQQQQEEQPPT